MATPQPQPQPQPQVDPMQTEAEQVISLIQTITSQSGTSTGLYSGYTAADGTTPHIVPTFQTPYQLQNQAHALYTILLILRQRNQDRSAATAATDPNIDTAAKLYEFATYLISKDMSIVGWTEGQWIDEYKRFRKARAAGQQNAAPGSGAADTFNLMEKFKGLERAVAQMSSPARLVLLKARMDLDPKDRTNSKSYEDFLKEYNAKMEALKFKTDLESEIPRALWEALSVVPNPGADRGDTRVAKDVVFDPLNATAGTDSGLEFISGDAAAIKKLDEERRKLKVISGGADPGQIGLLTDALAEFNQQQPVNVNPAVAPGAPQPAAAAPAEISETLRSLTQQSLGDTLLAQATLKAAITALLRNSPATAKAEIGEEFARLALTNQLTLQSAIAATRQILLAHGAAAEELAKIQSLSAILQDSIRVGDSTMQTMIKMLRFAMEILGGVSTIKEELQTQLAALRTNLATATTSNATADLLIQQQLSQSRYTDTAVQTALKSAAISVMGKREVNEALGKLTALQREITEKEAALTAALRQSGELNARNSDALAQLSEQTANLTRAQDAHYQTLSAGFTAATAAMTAAQNAQADAATEKAQLAELITSLNSIVRPAAAPRAGGAGPTAAAAAAAPTLETFREYRKTLDQAKKDIRGITVSLDGLSTRYDAFSSSINVEDAIRKRDDAVLTGNEAAILEAEKKIDGLDDYFKTDGKTFVDDFKAKIEENKKTLTKTQEAIQKILETEPANKNYIQAALNLKNAVEGDYEKTGTEAEGISAKMESVKGQLVSQYEKAFKDIKALAVGIKAAREERKERYKAQQPLAGVAAAAQTSTAVAAQRLNSLKTLIDQAKSEYIKAHQDYIDKAKAVSKAILDSYTKASAEVTRISGLARDEQDKPENIEKLAAATKAKDKAIADAVKFRAKFDSFNSDKIFHISTQSIDVIKTDPTQQPSTEPVQLSQKQPELDAVAAAVDAPATAPAQKESVATQSLSAIKESLELLKIERGSLNEIAATVLSSQENAKDASVADGSALIKGGLATIKKELDEKIMTPIIINLDNIYKRKLDPTFNASSAAAGEPGLFARIYNQYLDTKQRYDQNSFVAAVQLTQALKSNGLMPSEVLRVSAIDKTIFVFMTLFIRMGALALTEFLIEKGFIIKMVWALGIFLAAYITIFAIIVFAVNIDSYRLRIVFNYINFHANGGNVYSHVLYLLLFSALIYIIMLNINFPVPGVKVDAITDEQKSQLMYRIEVLTMIVWIFLMIMVVVMT